MWVSYFLKGILFMLLFWGFRYITCKNVNVFNILYKKIKLIFIYSNYISNKECLLSVYYVLYIF